MAYDENLADRIRELIAGEPDVTEKPMFGGLAFLVGGNVAKRQLEPWVRRGVTYARSLPPKA